MHTHEYIDKNIHNYICIYEYIYIYIVLILDQLLLEHADQLRGGVAGPIYRSIDLSLSLYI